MVGFWCNFRWLSCCCWCWCWCAKQNCKRWNKNQCKEIKTIWWYIWEREWKWESEAGGGRDNECELNCVYHPLHCFSSLFNYHILVATVMCTALKRWNKSKATMMIWGRMLAYVFYYSFSVLKLSDSERVCVCEWVYKCIHFYLLSLQFFQTIHLFKHSFIRSFAHSFSLYSFIFVLFFSGWNYTSHVQTLGKQLFQVSLSFIFCCELCRKKTIRTHVRNDSNSFSSRSFGRDKIIEINNWLCNVVQSERVVESTHFVIEYMRGWWFKRFAWNVRRCAHIQHCYATVSQDTKWRTIIIAMIKINEF